MELTKLQNAVNDLFYEIFKDYEGGKGYSKPLIPVISERYLENRVVVMGQETYTWYKQTDDDLKNRFLNQEFRNQTIENYGCFVNGTAKTLKSKFWIFSRRIYDDNILKGEFLEKGQLSHCWINLFCIEALTKKGDKNGTPTSNKTLAKEIIALQKDLHIKLLKLLKPKKIVFLTGPSLDGHLFDKSLGFRPVKSSLDAKEVLSPRQLAMITPKDENHFLADVEMIRTYHPSYFMGRINGLKKLKEKRILKGISETSANYYCSILMEQLKA